MWKQVVVYGAAVAAETLLLQWLDYRHLVRAHEDDLHAFLIALQFLALGMIVGARALRRPPPAPFDGNPQARAALGLSPRELTVPAAIAAGRSNKEIAAERQVSPNTVGTHVARLFEKLGARRR
ncbi:MAG: helix-turn-helix transcriptional regulator [Proteobacteria bacterium]|nr:helix-turn-helix transcriptional regulator [Pseudomonadota bacterium]